jgi:DNA-binding IclR family transcriptional regulator
MREGIERAGEMVERSGFTISAGEWQNDVHAVGVALKLNDGTGPYAFNCGAPAFRFTEERLRDDIGPRLVAMVRNIEAALGGTAPQSRNPETKKQEEKKPKPGGKVARVVEGIR